MSNILYRATYRPLRVGFCVNRGDLEALVGAFRFAHCLWGGRFNPIVVADDIEQSKQLVKAFKVDVLYPIGGDKADAFARSIPYLSWPFNDRKLFETLPFGNGDSTLIDISHPLLQFHEKHIRTQFYPRHRVSLYEWSEQDPLRLPLEAMLGRYPGHHITGIDYRDMVVRLGGGASIEIDQAGILHHGILRDVTPNKVSGMEIIPGTLSECVFVGHCDSFEDIVSFWNLRASGMEAYFYDPRHADRLKPIPEGFREETRRFWGLPAIGGGIVPGYVSQNVSRQEAGCFRDVLDFFEMSGNIWNPQAKEYLEPEVVSIKTISTLAHITKGQDGPVATVPITDKPWSDSPESKAQSYLLTLQTGLNLSPEEGFIFDVPNVPLLNPYLGRHQLAFNEVRVRNDGLGVITSVRNDHVLLYGLERFAFIQAFFEALGIRVSPSNAGRICEQLVRNMGGIQGCRVFKIAGVRDLISKFKPNESFEKTCASNIIRKADSSDLEKPDGFARYENLVIDTIPQGTRKLKHEDVFKFLLKQGVLRVGLEPTCGHCQLSAWRSLDDLASVQVCDFCGGQFEILSQLRDRNWSYRPSGLFGRRDHQEGAVPVALTLQQLDTVLSGKPVLWWPAMNLTPDSANIPQCEIDFLVATRDTRGELEIIIGECKARSVITAADVQNLNAVAAAIQSHGIPVYIVFSKAGSFSPAEIEICRPADGKGNRRTILLSERELEPMEIYELSKAELGNSIRTGLPDLEDMVDATERLFFRSKKSNEETSIS